MTAKSITIRCGHCGGAKVMRDAYAVWDDAQQDWVLGAVFDEGICDECGEDATLIEEPLPALFG